MSDVRSTIETYPREIWAKRRLPNPSCYLPIGLPDTVSDVLSGCPSVPFQTPVATGRGDHYGPIGVVTGLPSYRVLLLSREFRPSCVILFIIPSFSSPSPMSFGSCSVREPFVPKFDMHTFISSMMAKEVCTLVEEYAIHLDLILVFRLRT
nr:hypothetical protein [Tanacetum cinerariifolium]